MADPKLPKAWVTWRAIPEGDPKRLARLAEAGIKLRNERKALESQAKAIAAEEEALKTVLIDNFEKSALEEVKTKLGVARLVKKDIPITDPDTGGWEATYAYIVQEAIQTFRVKDAKRLAQHIAQHGFWDILHKRLGEKACESRWEEKQKIPGVKQFTKTDIKLGDAE